MFVNDGDTALRREKIRMFLQKICIRVRKQLSAVCQTIRCRQGRMFCPTNSCKSESADDLRRSPEIADVSRSQFLH
ncbi:hypothetical protein DPMN_144189 [Dreissena polymorpha]|uniref:Uncharacterized protein n=1 Tax=Dreissena polymorpha TaxID=45954 RepID=A0A9D4JNY2_DREPO|nr:hypothetical protein DPMN_144189 [Dreissena polymorpha]